MWSSTVIASSLGSDDSFGVEGLGVWGFRGLGVWNLGFVGVWGLGVWSLGV